MKYNYNLNIFFDKKESSYYLLGAFMTDGTIKSDGTCILTSKDEDWLQTIKNMICTDLPLHYGNSTKTVKNLTIHSKQLSNWFIENQCIPHKSLILNMPDIPLQYMPDFLRGAFDGDGCLGIGIQKNSGSTKKLNYNVYCELTSASKNFILKLSKQLDKFNFKNKIRIIKVGSRKPQIFNGRIIQQKNDIYTLRINGNNAYNLIKYMYYDGHQLSIMRKNNRAQFIIERCFKQKVKMNDAHIQKLCKDYRKIICS